mmetsp:Transcript_82993/g.231596  ORF Transcript_82993/g.231596 Transcript_82993/m.231596 type:complete len:207 (+) Transcript_82993:1710-2330(+)
MQRVATVAAEVVTGQHRRQTEIIALIVHLEAAMSAANVSRMLATKNVQEASQLALKATWPHSRGHEGLGPSATALEVWLLRASAHSRFDILVEVLPRVEAEMPVHHEDWMQRYHAHHGCRNALDLCARGFFLVLTSEGPKRKSVRHDRRHQQPPRHEWWQPHDDPPSFRWCLQQHGRAIIWQRQCHCAAQRPCHYPCPRRRRAQVP